MGVSMLRQGSQANTTPYHHNVHRGTVCMLWGAVWCGGWRGLWGACVRGGAAAAGEWR